MPRLAVAVSPGSGARHAPLPAPEPGGGEPSADHLGRLLDGLEGSRTVAPSADVQLGDALAALVLSAPGPRQLDERLRELGRPRGTGDVASVLPVLVTCLPNHGVGASSPRETSTLRAISRLVLLCHEPAQRTERLSALVRAAIAEFNRGGAERAGRVFDLALRLLAEGRLDGTLVEPLRVNGHRHLDLERLRRLIESRRPLPGSLLRFFQVFAPEALFDRVGREPRRGRRELLLGLLEAHGAPARALARERLLRLRGEEADPLVVASLVRLLRRLPRDVGEGPVLDHEVRAVAHLLTPRARPSVVGEALLYLGHTPDHPAAEAALVLFLGRLEDEIHPLVGGASGDRVMTALDQTAAALAEHGSRGSREALVEHGLRKEPWLGDPPSRLLSLGSCDLSATPELACRMIEAVRDCLPPGFLTALPATQAPRVLRIVGALRSTPMPEVRELLRFLAARFPLQAVGAEAARTLEAFDTRRTAPVPSASLWGDTRIFGLPALLQNLADGGVTGVLLLGDTARPSAATFVFEKGRLRGVRAGESVGAPAVYRLLQRPFDGHFTFLHRPGVVSWTGQSTGALDMSELILEGLRRSDELPRLTRRVPDDAIFEATGRPPTVADEWDIDVVTSLWERATGGASPLACEEALGVDAWQVRRCLAHWVEDASLLPRSAAPGHEDTTPPAGAESAPWDPAAVCRV
jgi:hypothetical protein